MKKLWIILILCAIAFVNAGYLVNRAYELKAIEETQKNQPFSSFCDVNDTLSCSRVLTHERAQFFGYPFPVVAFVVYPILALIAILGLAKKCAKAYPILVVMAALGSCMNGYYIYQEAVNIGAFCPLCLLCTGIIVTVFLISLVGWIQQPRTA